MTKETRTVMLFVLLVLLTLLAAGCRRSATSNGEGAVDVTLEVQPRPPVAGQSTLFLTLTDADGNPLEGASLSVKGDMNHASMEPVLREAQSGPVGVAEIPFEWTMGGDWIIFAASTVSPTQIAVTDPEVCRTCEGKECVNGGEAILGCGTELFPPQITSNMDCVLCLDCARACLYDNVTLVVRSPLHQLSQVGAWPRRWDWGFLILIFAFAGLGNAFGMVPPVYALQETLAGQLGTESEGLVLALIFGVILLALPAGVGLGVAWLSRALSGRDESLRVAFSRFVPAVVPLAAAIWLAHYGFHFATGALSIVPVAQSFAFDHGVTLLGQPDWSLSALLPRLWLTPLEILITLAGLGGSLYLLGERARHTRQPLATQLPWIGLMLLLALAAVLLFTMPMEMRGTSFMN